MAKYELNQEISFVNNPSIKGKITFIYKPEGGHQYYDILTDTGSVKQDVPEYDIEPKVEITDAWSAVSYNKFADYNDFSISSTFYKIRNTTSNSIATLHAARTVFMPHQFKPLMKFLNSGINRVLIADEVGLGKTIEAGYILLELFARKQLRNVLVLCPKSLCDKWHDEMLDRFNFSFKIFNTAKDIIEDVKIDSERGVKSIFGISNYEKFCKPELIDLLKNRGYYFDLVICDEAHKLRNHNTLVHKSVKEIVPFAKATVFLTATPVMNKVEDFYYLTMLLDEEHYADRKIFYNDIEINKPFIKALKTINNSLQATKKIEDSSAIIEQLDSHDVNINLPQFIYSETKKINEIFKDNEIYQDTKKLLSDNQQTPKQIVDIQRNLTELNNFSYLFTRSRKKSVYKSNELVTRNPIIRFIDLNQKERKQYDEIFDQSGSMGLVIRKRQAASCLPAYFSDEQLLLNGICDKNIPDAKLQVLLDILKELNKPKIIIFTYFRKTLLYIRLRLMENNYNIEYIMGGGDKNERTEKLSNFETNTNIQILLATEVGSEGIDLQFCDTIVNYDLPWNPMVIEQRIGRIDRIGQMAKSINIVSLFIKDSIEMRIYDRLLSKIKVFENTIGDLSEILTEGESLYEEFDKLQEKLYTEKLTEEQQNEEIDKLDIILKAQTEQLINTIEKDLDSSLVYDIQVEQEIKDIQTNKKYLTDIDIRKYIDSALRNAMPTIRLEQNKVEKHKFIIRTDGKNLNSIFDFIEKYRDKNFGELEAMSNQFKSKFMGETSIPVIFNREYAFKLKGKDKEKNVFINVSHPLINAITNYFEKHRMHENLAFAIAIKHNDIKDIPCPEKSEIPHKGKYLLIQYKIELNVNDRQLNYIYSLICNLNKYPETEFLPEKQSEFILGVAQENAMRPTINMLFKPEHLVNIRSEIRTITRNRKDEIERNEKKKQESRINRRYNQKKLLYELQIKRREEWIKNNANENIKNLWAGEIRNYQNEIALLEEQLAKLKVYAESSVISVNYLQII